jgi:hypothetical protein
MVDAENFKTTGNARVVPGIKRSSKGASPVEQNKQEKGNWKREPKKNEKHYKQIHLGGHGASRALDDQRSCRSVRRMRSRNRRPTP